MSFKKNGYAVKKNVLNKQTLNLLASQFEILKDCEYFFNNIDKSNASYFDDELVCNAFSWYGNYAFESLLLVLQKDIEKITGKKLFPCYSYARIMYKGANMPRHIDRPSCEYSVSVCIKEDKNNPYPIFMENLSKEVNEIYLNPGDILVYQGTKLYHWRENYKGNGQIQAFLHYVDSLGDFKNFKNDQRPLLGLSGSYRNSTKVE